MITNYDKKFAYLNRKQDGLCPIAKEEGDLWSPTELHHRLARHKLCIKRFPLFIDSRLESNRRMSLGAYGKAEL